MNAAADVTDSDESLDSLVALVKSSDAEEQLRGVRGLRMFFADPVDPPIGEVVASGVVPFLVLFLDAPSMLQQYEAVWVLSFIASGSTADTMAVVTAGAVPPLVRMIQSPNELIREQAMCALGNIVADSVPWRDLVLVMGAMPLLLDAITDLPEESLYRVPLWFVSNLCRGTPSPDLENVCRAIPVLAAFLRSDVPEFLTDACWGLAELSSEAGAPVQKVIDSGVVPRLVELLLSPVESVATWSLRCIGNCLSGGDDHTQAVLDAGGLAALVALLGSPLTVVRKGACWGLSNIASGAESQVEAFFASGAVPILVAMMRDDVPIVRIEVCWTLANATRIMRVDHIRLLLEHGALEALASMLFESDDSVLAVALEGLDNLTRVGLVNDLAVVGRFSDKCVTQVILMSKSAGRDVRWRATELLEVLRSE
jgi:importin subunit alpha-1